MSIEEKIRLMVELDALVRRKALLGNADAYARKLRISRASFFRLISYLKSEFDVPIFYDKSRNRYVYETDGALFFGFVASNKLSDDNMRKISGGSIPHSIFVSFNALQLPDF